MALAAACAATMALVPATASANGGGSVSPRDPGAKKFVGEITVPKIGEHLTALQRIATLNDDTREVFSPGYQESLDYVVETLKASGYRPQVTQFNYPTWSETQPAVLNMVSPTPPKTYKPGTAADDGSPNVDFITMANSPTTVLTNAPVFPVVASSTRRRAARPAVARRATTPASPARSRSSSAERARSSRSGSSRRPRARPA